MVYYPTISHHCFVMNLKGSFLEFFIAFKSVNFRFYYYYNVTFTNKKNIIFSLLVNIQHVR